MDRWLGDFHRGMRHLSGHDPSAAIPYFSRAVRKCPVSRSEELTRLLYYLGMALKRAGYNNSAIRSWIASQKMKKREHTRILLERFCNSYGMAKQACEDLDDWQAFYAIQLMRYLRGFNKRTLTSASERSMLRDVIREGWEKLQATGALCGKDAEEKHKIFESTKMEFPLFYQSRIRDPLLRVNFDAGRRLRVGDPCPCGSGLSYGCCCGRTPGEEELTIGLF